MNEYQNRQAKFKKNLWFETEIQKKNVMQLRTSVYTSKEEEPLKKQRCASRWWMPPYFPTVKEEKM